LWPQAQGHIALFGAMATLPSTVEIEEGALK